MTIPIVDPMTATSPLERPSSRIVSVELTSTLPSSRVHSKKLPWLRTGAMARAYLAYGKRVIKHQIAIQKECTEFKSIVQLFLYKTCSRLISAVAFQSLNCLPTINMWCVCAIFLGYYEVSVLWQAIQISYKHMTSPDTSNSRWKKVRKT